MFILIGNIMTYEEMITVITAAKEGKTIQSKPKADNHANWQDNSLLMSFNFYSHEYRVKPENKFRPFKNADEAFKEAKKHGFWVKYGAKSYSMITNIDGESSDPNFVKFCVACDQEWSDANYMLETFTWADDDSPCGILE